MIHFQQGFGVLALLVGCSWCTWVTTDAFSPTTTTTTTLGAIVGCRRKMSYSFQHHPLPCRQLSFILRERRPDAEDTNEADSDGGLLGRFFNPRIDDPFLPLTEAGLVQVVGPTLQLFWLVSLDSPYPSWAQPLYDYTFAAQGAFLAPTLIHGAALSCCWLLGCLAARAYELPNFRAKDGAGDNYGRVVSSTLQAGAFASGILILATQLDLFQEFGGQFVQVGDSPETDLRIYRALVEVINDIFFEFIVLLPWRLFRSNFD